MIRNIYLGFILLLTSAVGAFSQGGAGTVSGVIKDSKTGEPIPFANVVVESGGMQFGLGQSNIDGVYTIKPIDPGTYEVKCSYVGYKPVKTTGVIVSAGKITTVNISLESSVVDIKEFEVIAYDVPLIDDYQGKTLTKEEIIALPTRSVQSVAATTAGVTQTDEGSGINVRGSRQDATFYFVDGIKVRGSTQIPQQGIEQIQVITGGIPAMYGDATGGVISITTRGPSKRIAGGFEAVTSEGLDGYGYNLFGGSITGPLASRTSADGKKQPYIGFFLATEFAKIADNNPSANGNDRIKKDVLEELQQNPLTRGQLGFGTVRSAQYVRATDIENVRRRENAGLTRGSLNAKVDFKISEAINLTFGGTWDYLDQNVWSYTFSMFTPETNPRRIDNTYRIYGRMTQRFGSQQAEQQSASNIKNVYYSLQVDYTRNLISQGNDRHREDFFSYGHLGKFTTSKVPLYEVRIDTLNGAPVVGWWQTGFQDTLFAFQASGANPLLSRYTEQYYELAQGISAGNYRNLAQVQQGGGLLNGQNSGSVYSLFWNTGFNFNGFQKVDNTQFRVVGNASADIKKHEIKFGFEYEQRADRSWFLAPMNLWGIARQLANRHIEQLDFANPQPVFVNGVFQDTVNYDRLYSQSSQTFFDRNLRQSLGLPINSTQWLDTDNYDPSVYNLNMFSADELFNGGGGASLTSYFGFNHLGERIKGRRTLDQFFNDRDEFGNFKREIGAFTPIYMAAYVQDKFAFRDLIFNVGVRVDRFDANQSVLKDPYSLVETRKAREFNIDKPGNIGDDYVVYVRDINNTNTSDASNVVGYRDGDRWFNAQGSEIQDPQVLAQATTTGQIAPALLNPSETTITSAAFEDYKPQINIMPRIAFQFPISDEAQFFAHYDVLTQRPTDGARLDPIDYLFIANNVGNIINNPNLKPQRTIDYEVGFKQVISQSSAITISAFYRELRNLIQVIPVNYAYPVNYITFGNIDFGTVKGLSIVYDLRRTGNVRLTANYTLQFAEGTGSSATGGLNLLNSGQPNLRTTVPLNFDVRHQIQTTFDYRYGEGKFYNGPRIKGKNIFENTGANFVLLANSGVPYSRSSVFTQDGAFGVANRPLLQGSLNGSRLPFQYRINMRVDKDFDISRKKGENASKPLILNIYFFVQNLLNTQNIISVYRATGNPDDDGFLTAATSQTLIAGQVNPVSFAELYASKINNPNNFSRPRIFRIGAIFNF
jgi:outer membrane receptor protein involved in Fe transport